MLLETDDSSNVGRIISSVDKSWGLGVMAKAGNDFLLVENKGRVELTAKAGNVFQCNSTPLGAWLYWFLLAFNLLDWR